MHVAFVVILIISTSAEMRVKNKTELDACVKMKKNFLEMVRKKIQTAPSDYRL